ncbi:N-acetylmuramoyl-L-alanine amidase [Azospirillaceae bacterium]
MTSLTIKQLPSLNHGPRPQNAVIDILLVHYTGMPTAQIALERLCDPKAQVSAHYTIDEDGTILRHVEESQRAWHAGVGFWRGDRDVNSRSIGIELVNPGHEFGYRPFPKAQMTAFLVLAHDILKRHPTIRSDGVLGHADVACARKEDPGELFDWKRCAEKGIGFWPNLEDCDLSPSVSHKNSSPAEEARALLQRYGYDTQSDNALTSSLIAFQHHFRPSRLTGFPDSETLCILRAAVRQTGRAELSTQSL